MIPSQLIAINFRQVHLQAKPLAPQRIRVGRQAERVVHLTDEVLQLHLVDHHFFPPGTLRDGGVGALVRAWRDLSTLRDVERFDAWLKGWFERHQFEPVTSAIFLADIREHLVKGDAALEQRLMLDDWVYQPGIPANVVKPDPNAFAEVDKAVQRFSAAKAIPAQQWPSTARR